MGKILLETAEFALTKRPDRAIMVVRGLTPDRARECANVAVYLCKKKMPKSTGMSSSRIQPIWDRNYFGIRWLDSYVWFQDHGIRAFTMTSLEGKTIPMWIDDPTGTERQKNPKAKVRTTLSGKVQVLIFRKVGRRDQGLGQKTKIDPKTKLPVTVVDKKAASYPGAPGRIALREAGKPLTTQGRRAGAIARGNIGVKWRHPGLEPRLFINNSITVAAQLDGIMPLRIYLADERWKAALR